MGWEHLRRFRCLCEIHYFFLIMASEAVCVSPLSSELSRNLGVEAGDGEDAGAPAPASRLKGCRVACSKENHLGTHADGD